MGKCKSFMKLLKLLWDNSGKVIDVFEKAQSKLPLIVQALKNSGNRLEEAANLIGSAEWEIGNKLGQVGGNFNNIKIPKFELKTDGFMDAFMRSIRSVLDVPIHDPPENVKNSVNNIRVLTMLNLEGQASPFQAVNSYLNIEGQTIVGVSDSSREALHNTSQGLLEFAGILEDLE